MKKLLVAGIAAVALWSASAQAQVPYNWSGVYLGGSAGWEGSQITTVNPAFPPGISFNQNSGMLGVHLGVQRQFGQIVVGVEGSFQGSLLTGQGFGAGQPCVGSPPVLTPGGAANCFAKLASLWTVGPR